MENECLTDLLEVYSPNSRRIVRPPVVNDILPPGLHLLVGPSAAGKTILALCLTDAVLNGDKFLGHPTREGDVYLILLDRGREQNSSRLDANIRANSKRMPTVIYGDKAKRRGLPLLKPLLKVVENYYRTLRRKLRLLVIDSLTTALPDAREEQDYYEALKLLRKMTRFVDAVLIIHHSNKAGYCDDPFPNEITVKGYSVIMQMADGRLLLNPSGAYRGLQVRGHVAEQTDFLLKSDGNYRMHLLCEVQGRLKELFGYANRAGASFSVVLDGLKLLRKYHAHGRRVISAAALQNAFEMAHGTFLASIARGVGYRRLRPRNTKSRNVVYQLVDNSVIFSSTLRRLLSGEQSKGGK